MTDLKAGDVTIKFPTIRRIGADHYTEHDFEMERVGAEQDAATYEERLKVLEDHGWMPFRGPFYYGRREFHGGHHPPGTKKRVPTKVAFAMFKEANPDVELPEYKPHPHGWTPPPSTQGLVHQELVKVEPMKEPVGAIFNYKEPETETEKEHQTRKARLAAVFKDLPGVRSYGERRGGKFLTRYVFVVLEAEEYRAGVPDTWDSIEVRVEVKPEAEERAEKEIKDQAALERYEEEAKWLRRARCL